MAEISTKSEWYPYQKVQEGFCDLLETVDIPRKICDYILDAPKGDYKPPDNNAFSRCALWKYLYYDTPHPLKEKLPSIKQKMSVLFNPEKPENPPSKKGYRLIPQVFFKQAQEEAQTRIYVYMGRTVARDDYTPTLSVVFDIWTHYTYELNTKQDQYSRVFAIEQALIQAFHGVNISGVGTFHLNKNVHPDCGSRVIWDKDTNVGRELVFGLDVATGVGNAIGATENMPLMGENGVMLW